MRPASEDVDTADSDARVLVCGWCGSTRQVLWDSNPPRCSLCLADEAVVAEVRAGLVRAKLPPLGRPAKRGQGGERSRRKGEEALARLAGRREVGSSGPSVSSAQSGSKRIPAANKPTEGLRRLTVVEKRAALRRLSAVIRELERELRRPGTSPSARRHMHEDLAAARTLFRGWDDGIH